MLFKSIPSKKYFLEWLSIYGLLYYKDFYCNNTMDKKHLNMMAKITIFIILLIIVIK